jgi:hypothetical protein
MIDIRIAEAKDSPRLAYMAQHYGGFKFEGFDVDWSNLGRNWLVADDGELIVGALQVSPAFPIGHLEFLLTEPEMGKKKRAVVVRDLIDGGVSVLQQLGVQVACGTIPFDFPDYRKAAVRRGWVPMNECEIMLKRVAP